MFGLFLGYVVFWYLQVGYRYPELGEIRFEFILGAILSVLALPNLLRIHVQGWSRLHTWFVFLLLVMAMMVARSIDRTHSLDVFIDRVVKFAMLGLFVVAFVQSSNQLRLFVVVFLLVFMKMSQEGVFGYFTGSLVWENQGIPRLHGATPNYAHPNSLSGTQLAVLPFIVFLYPLVPRWAKVVLAGHALAILFIVIVTGSRTGYVGLVFCALAIAVLAKNRRRSLRIICLAGFIGLLVVPQDYINRAVSIFDHDSEHVQGRSTQLRMEILTDAATIFIENPMGVGVGAFPRARTARFGRSQDTHNLYLEVATNLGVLGLIGFGGFMGVLIKTLLDLRRNLTSYIVHNPDDGDARWLHALSNALLAFLATRLALGLFGMDLYEVYWWFAMGLTIASVRIAEDKGFVPMRSGAGRRLTG